MTKRSIIIASALAATALAPLPAVARDKSLADATERMQDPAFQQGMATALGTMMRALMGMKISPFAKAMDEMKRANGEPVEPSPPVNPDATLADMMGEDGRRAPEQIAARLPAMMSTMAGMAGTMERMRPELEKMGREMARKLPRDMRDD